MADDEDRRIGQSSPTDALSRTHGWMLLVVLLMCFVLIPGAIIVWPPTFVPYRDAYLALSLVPGIVLGAVGVWTALRYGR